MQSAATQSLYTRYDASYNIILIYYDDDKKGSAKFLQRLHVQYIL